MYIPTYRHGSRDLCYRHGRRMVSKFVWPKHNMINQQVGVANNDKRAKCWCDTCKVGVTTATPAIQHSPPMPIGMRYRKKKC